MNQAPFCFVDILFARYSTTLKILKHPAGQPRFTCGIEAEVLVVGLGWATPARHWHQSQFVSQ
jgi:hypothetical protein